MTLAGIEKHFKSEHPYNLKLQRYIIGRPNLLRIPIIPVREDRSLHFQAGTQFHHVTDHVMVWCYTDKYPARIDVDCQYLSPNNPIKIGDVEKMLPYGTYLHKKYDQQRFHAVAKLELTNTYVQKKNLILEQ